MLFVQLRCSRLVIRLNRWGHLYLLGSLPGKQLSVCIRALIRQLFVQLFPDRVLGSDSMTRFRAVDDDLLTISRDIREMNISKLIIGFTLVHLLLDATATFNSIHYIFLELLVRRGAIWMQDLEEGAYRLLDAFFISTFHRFA